MSKYSNLFLVINLGCEMIYVVHQRIHAQKIPNNRGIQVLTDITEVLLNEILLKELASAKTLASHEYIRVLLKDIVSVSIMRLDDHSMRKLWELMTMVFKWQLTLSEEKSLVTLTTRHLHGISNLSQLQSVQMRRRISETIELFNKIDQEISPEEMILIRRSLMHWLCDFRTNISLLLRLGFQRNDGSFILTSTNLTHINNLGQNIYTSDESNDADNDDQAVTFDGNSPELIFVISSSGNETLTKNNNKIRFRLFEQQKAEEKAENSVIYYSQSDSVEPKNNLRQANDHESENVEASVHDDLIKMLDLN